MAEPIKLLTQQGKSFDLLGKTGPVDVSRSEYARTHPLYLDCRRALDAVVGKSQYLWCIDARESFVYVPERKVEWLIEVDESAILGYVQDDPWEDFILGKRADLGDGFSRTRPAGDAIQMLVRFPFVSTEIVNWWDLEKGKPPLRGRRPPRRRRAC
jgi:hypothetical protein